MEKNIELLGELADKIEVNAMKQQEIIKEILELLKEFNKHE